MKHLLTLLFVIVVVYNTSAQSFVKYNRFYLDDFEYNPAIAGINNQFTGLFSVKKSWVGMENSPSTQNLFIHTSLARLGFSDPKDFIARNTEKLGLGLSIYNDKNGPLSLMKLQLSVAYHTPISNDLKLSFGLSSQLMQNSLDYNMLEVIDEDDPLITNRMENEFAPNFTAGLWLSNEKFHLGFSVMDVADLTQGESFYSDKRTYFLSGGYKFKLSESFDLQQKLLAYADEYAGFKINTLTKISYKKLVWLGLGYTLPNSYMIYIALKRKRFDFGYSFEYTNGPVYYNTGGNHMVFIGYNL